MKQTLVLNDKRLIYFGFLRGSRAVSSISDIVGLLVCHYHGKTGAGLLVVADFGPVALAAGVALLSGLIAGTKSIAFILTAFLVIDGSLMIIFGREHRKSLSAQWGWLVVNGVVDLVLAGLIVSALPGSAVWALGLIVGINPLFGGWSLIAMALYARHQAL